MPETAEELLAFLERNTARGTRNRPLARGLARGMVWRDGIVPPGAQDFGVHLTSDLLDHGYLLLAKAVSLRAVQPESAAARDGCIAAAECIESAVRRGPRDEQRDFHLVIASVAYHLGRLPARAFCLAPPPDAGANLSTPERLLVGLMRRDLRFVRESCVRWLRNPQHRDDGVAQRLVDPNDDFGIEDAEVTALITHLTRAVGEVVGALESGNREVALRGRNALEEVAKASGSRGLVSLWWSSVLASHLASDIWENSFHTLLPSIADEGAGESWNQLRSRYINLLFSRTPSHLDLWPSQVEAARRAIDPTDDLVVALPTSAGKTRIAELCILRALSLGKRVVYVTPLRALSAQVEKVLSHTFAPLGASVTALYGASGIAQADIATIATGTVVVATPEKLDFALRVQPGVIDDVGLIVLDEGHMIGFGHREFRYEVLVHRLLTREDAEERRLVCLSAIFTEGDAFSDFTSWIRSGAAGEPIVSGWRPTRQRIGEVAWGSRGGRLELSVEEERPFVPRFIPREEPRGRRRNTFPQDDAEFVVATAKAFVQDGHKVLIYCPQRRSIEPLAELCLTLNRQGYLPTMLDSDHLVSSAVALGEEWLGPDHPVVRCLRIGIAVHHGLLPRPFLAEVESLIDRRVVSMVIASPTVAQGLDLSFGVLVFRSIYRRGDTPIPAAEFANVRGRVGRAFADLDGITVYPIFGDGYTGERKRRAYRRLQVEAEHRELESGVLQLVNTLIAAVAELHDVDDGELLEYLAGNSLDWEGISQSSAVAPDTEVNSENSMEELLAALDVVILGTVDDLDSDLTELADALDRALAGSLYTRRRDKLPPTEAALTTALVVDRAKWIWNRSTPTTRRGYFAAGVGLNTGAAIHDNLDELLRGLSVAEVAFQERRPQDAVVPLVEVAEILSQIPPFIFEHEVENWREILRAWVTGSPIAPLAASIDTVGFVQNDIVYRLVWAVEAVRVHGVAQGRAAAEDLSGIVAQVLTYGLPNLDGHQLARAGLPSRIMADRLVTQFPEMFAQADSIQEVVTALSERIDAPFWGNESQAQIWRAFAGRWADPRSGAWDHIESIVEADWNGIPPAQDSEVRIVHDTIEGVSFVCRSDLEPIGQLRIPVAFVARGHATGYVTDDGRVRLMLFAPLPRGA